jgi:RNA 3'-terminal phosphate cyclase
MALQFSIQRQLAGHGIRVLPRFIQTPATPSNCGGIGILLFAETTNHNRIAASTMIEISTKLEYPEQLKQAILQGRHVATTLAQQLADGGAVDEYLADQLIIFMALATSGVQPSLSQGDNDGMEGGRCEILVGKVSVHTLTAMKIAEIMLGNITLSRVTMDGIGDLIVCERKGDLESRRDIK